MGLKLNEDLHPLILHVLELKVPVSAAGKVAQYLAGEGVGNVK